MELSTVAASNWNVIENDYITAMQSRIKPLGMGELWDLQQTSGVSPVHPQLFPFEEKMFNKANSWPSKMTCQVKRKFMSTTFANKCWKHQYWQTVSKITKWHLSLNIYYNSMWIFNYSKTRKKNKVPSTHCFIVMFRYFNLRLTMHIFTKYLNALTDA